MHDNCCISCVVDCSNENVSICIVLVCLEREILINKFVIVGSTSPPYV